MTRNATEDRARKVATVLVSMPLPCNGAGVSYTCTSIVAALMVRPRRQHIYPVRPCGSEGQHSVDRDDADGFANPAVLAHQEAGDQAERAFLSGGSEEAAADGKGIAYVWPEPSLSLVRQIRDLGVPIVRESVNCHQATGKKILDAEYIRLGLTQRRPMTEAIDRIRAPSARPL